MEVRKNALKAGIVIVVSLVIIVLGIRFLQNVPFGGTYEIYTEFSRVDGLIKGNKVQVSGVDIGRVTNVALNTETQQVRVDMRINNGITIPQGTTAEQTGISTIGTVQIAFNLGPAANPPIENGGRVPSVDKDDIFTNLVNRVDSTLIGTSDTFQQISNLLEDPASDLRTTLASMAALTNALRQTVAAEQQRLSALLQSLEQTSQTADQTLGSTGDSLAIVLNTANATLASLDQTSAQLRSVSVQLDQTLTKINSGQGTLGLLVNDPSLYHNLDSTLTNFNRLLTDLQTNPRRYLRELRVVDLF